MSTTLSDPQEVGIDAVRAVVEEWRGNACIVIHREAAKSGPASSKMRMEADDMERRAAVLVRKMERLMRLRDLNLSQIRTISLPRRWTMSDLDAALKALGADDEDRPLNPNKGPRQRTQQE